MHDEPQTNLLLWRTLFKVKSNKWEKFSWSFVAPSHPSTCLLSSLCLFFMSTNSSSPLCLRLILANDTLSVHHVFFICLCLHSFLFTFAHSSSSCCLEQTSLFYPAAIITSHLSPWLHFCSSFTTSTRSFPLIFLSSLYSVFFYCSLYLCCPTFISYPFKFCPSLLYLNEIHIFFCLFNHFCFMHSHFSSSSLLSLTALKIISAH